jgi:hypothetical protein
VSFEEIQKLPCGFEDFARGTVASVKALEQRARVGNACRLFRVEPSTRVKPLFQIDGDDELVAVMHAQ